MSSRNGCFGRFVPGMDESIERLARNYEAGHDDLIHQKFLSAMDTILMEISSRTKNFRKRECMKVKAELRIL